MLAICLTEDHFLCCDMRPYSGPVTPQGFLEWLHLIDMVFGDSMWSQVYPKIMELVHVETGIPDVSGDTMYFLTQAQNFYFFEKAWDMAECFHATSVSEVPHG